MSSITTTTTTTTTTTSTSTTTATPTSVDLRVGAFNAATFGSTKVSKDYVLDVLKQVSGGLSWTYHVNIKFACPHRGTKKKKKLLSKTLPTWKLWEPSTATDLNSLATWEGVLHKSQISASSPFCSSACQFLFSATMRSPYQDTFAKLLTQPLRTNSRPFQPIYF